MRQRSSRIYFFLSGRTHVNKLHLTPGLCTRRPCSPRGDAALAFDPQSRLKFPEFLPLPRKLVSSLTQACIEFYARRLKDAVPLPPRAVAISRHDVAQSLYESCQDSLLRVMIAVPHQDGAGVAHNLGGQE
jgi:hypothetical protein